MAENIQPMAPRQFGQFGNGLRNEGHGLVGRPSLSSVAPEPCLKRDASAGPQPWSITCIQILPISVKTTLFNGATLGGISQLLRYKVVPHGQPSISGDLTGGASPPMFAPTRLAASLGGTRLYLFP